jgi:hypothetical protein
MLKDAEAPTTGELVVDEVKRPARIDPDTLFAIGMGLMAPF